MKETLKHYRLSFEEYQNIVRLLGHKPSRGELALFSAMWSEHCSYKSSREHLKKLRIKHPRVVKGFGENAGVVDLGEGEKVAFKVESHNHPSFITPYQGALTGVGGILRDIFVMNARPLALANYLCFGLPPAASEKESGSSEKKLFGFSKKNSSFVDRNNRGGGGRWKELLGGVVQGIGDYGNCMGIPTVTGQVEFHPSYENNVVVNALAVGYLGPQDPVMTSQPGTQDVGSLLVYGGALTGRDGIHGASMASESFNKQEDKTTCVQIGDPFYGKLLMEACLEAIGKNLVTAAQDMGAAGLVSSSFEMISKARLGMDLHVDKVPLRDATMTLEDILLSETQERVLFVVHPSCWQALKSVFEKWNLPVACIGTLTSHRKAKLFWKDKCEVCIDPLLLTEKSPQAHRPFTPWKAKHRTSSENLSFPRKRESTLHHLHSATVSSKNNKSSLSQEETHLLSMMRDLRSSHREFVYQQYDQSVGGATVKGSSFPFGVLKLPHSGRALAVCMGGRPYLMQMDAYEGGKDAVFKPALQLAAFGFSPLALTDGLNFGSPENKEVMSEFVACVTGISEGALSLNTPVVSGNVSLYNETCGVGVTPTPVTAMVGVKKTLPVVCNHIGSNIKEYAEEGTSPSLGVYLLSAQQMVCRGLFAQYEGKSPLFHGTLKGEVCRQFQKLLLYLHSCCPPKAIRLVSKLGLAYHLALFAMFSKKSLKVQTSYPLFQERLYEVIVLLTDHQAKSWQTILSQPPSGLKTGPAFSSVFRLQKLGTLLSRDKNPSLYINDCVALPLSDLREAYHKVCPL